MAVSAAVSISLVGEDLLQVTESNLTLTLQLEVRGLSLGEVTVRVVPVSYSDFETLRTMYAVNSTLEDLAAGRDIPGQSALPCECCRKVTAS